MKLKIFTKVSLIVVTITLLVFTYMKLNESDSATEERVEITSLENEVKGSSSEVRKMTKEEVTNAAIPFEAVEKSKIKIPTDLTAKNIKHINKAVGKTAEKRPGGYLITTYYETDLGDGQLVVSQSVNSFGDTALQLEDVKHWYAQSETGSKEFLLNGMSAVIHENKINFNTLHVITDTEIYTFAGQSTEYLIEVAEIALNEVQ